MLKRRAGVAGAAAWTILVVAAGTSGVAAQTRLESVEPYLMERQAEIELARSAAPRGIGAEATVFVLTRNGYERAVRGTNGFTCFVGRGWSGILETGPADQRRVNPDVFDRGLRAPHCLNEVATKSVWPLHELRTRLLLEGHTVPEIVAETGRALRDGRLSPPVEGAFAYMMSAGQRLGNAGAFRPHVMLYLPGATNLEWGADGLSLDYPFVADGGEPFAIVVIPTPAFSDGSRATAPTGG